MAKELDFEELEGRHQASDDPFWQESWYFNFSDEKNRVYGLARIGYCPKAGKADGLLLASVDGEPAVLFPGVGKKMSSPAVVIEPPGLLRTGGLSFSCREPMSSWALALSTRRVRAALEFDCFTPVHVFPSPSAGEGAMAATDHYEQAGRVTGAIRIGSQRKTVEGWGQRDHSWGPRHWSGVGEWVWISAQFPSAWAFNYWRVGGNTLSPQGGFLGTARKNTPLIGGDVTWEGDPDGMKPAGAHIRLEPEGGETREIRFSPRAWWPLYKSGAILSETFGTFTCGDETGVGVCEHLKKSRLGPLPVMPHVPGLAWTAVKSL